MTDQLVQSMSMPGERPDFVDLAERYKCVICHKVLQAPMMSMCGHRGCNSCFEEVKEKHTGSDPVMCPVGGEDCLPITQVMPDIGTYRELQRLDVYCLNKSLGCTSIQSWNKLREHMPLCQYALEDCINKGFGCPAQISKIKLQEHLDKECQFRTKQCQHCEVRLLESMLEGHIRNQCPMVSIPCPFKCGEQSIQRGELTNHKRVCKAKPKECKFRETGCSFYGTQDEVRQHETQDMSLHLEMMNTEMKEVKKENETLKYKVEQLEGARASTALPENVENKMKLIDRKQDSHENSIKNTQKLVAQMNLSVQNMGTKQEITNLRENVKSMEKQLEAVKSSSSSSQSTTGMERSLGLTNMRLQELDMRLQCMETANFDGVLVWKIRDFHRRRTEAESGRTVSLYSQPFYTSRYGYKACARLYLNGDGMGKGTHISLFFVILRGDFDALMPWPFRQKVTMTLLDQESGKKNIVDSFRADPTSNSFRRPTSDMNIASGCPLFAPRSIVESLPHLKDDCIFLKIHVDTTDLKDSSKEK